MTRLSSAWVKINQIPRVNFEMTSQFLFKLSIILHCHLLFTYLNLYLLLVYKSSRS